MTDENEKDWWITYVISAFFSILFAMVTVRAIIQGMVLEAVFEAGILILLLLIAVHSRFEISGYRISRKFEEMFEKQKR